MALPDLAVYFYFKFFAAVAGFAFNVNALADCVFIPFNGHFIAAERAFYFFFLGSHICSFQDFNRQENALPC